MRQRRPIFKILKIGQSDNWANPHSENNSKSDISKLDSGLAKDRP